MHILRIISIIIIALALIVVASHFAHLTTWLNDLMGNMDYNPDIKENAAEHAGENRFANRDRVFAIVNKYAKIMKEVNIKSYDGTRLSGSYLVGENPNLWVILIHGYTARNITMFTIADRYHKKGYSVLAPDLRGHGKSSGFLTTYGIKESKDIFWWIDRIKSQNKNAKIILQGESLGAATAMYVIGQNPKEVIACIEDCGYTTYYGIYEHQTHKRLRFLYKPAALIANLFIKPLIGADLFKSTEEAIKKTKIPTLFIHGSKDDIVPIQMCYTLYNSHPGKKQIYIAQGTDHAENKLFDEEVYYGRIFGFLDEVVGENKSV